MRRTSCAPSRVVSRSSSSSSRRSVGDLRREALDLQHHRRQRLADLVVQLARDAPALALLHQQRLARALAPLGLEAVEHLVERPRQRRDSGPPTTCTRAPGVERIDLAHRVGQRVQRPERRSQQQHVEHQHRDHARRPGSPARSARPGSTPSPAPGPAARRRPRARPRWPRTRARTAAAPRAGGPPLILPRVCPSQEQRRSSHDPRHGAATGPSWVQASMVHRRLRRHAGPARSRPTEADMALHALERSQPPSPSTMAASTDGPRTILVGVDGSDESRLAFSAAMERAGPQDTVAVIHARPPVAGWLGSPYAQRRLERSLPAKASASWTSSARARGHGRPARASSSTRAPRRSAGRLGELRDADEIVVGARRLGRLRALVSSVSRALLRGASRPCWSCRTARPPPDPSPRALSRCSPRQRLRSQPAPQIPRACS